MAKTASTYADTLFRFAGDKGGKVMTFYAAASTEYNEGDFVTVDTDGTLNKASTDGQSIDGIVMVDVDNSDGSDEDLKVPILVQGNCIVDGIFDATGGSFDDAATIGLAMGVAGDGGTTAAEAQALAATPGGSGETEFTSLSIHALPATGTEVVLMLAYFKGSSTFA